MFDKYLNTIFNAPLKNIAKFFSNMGVTADAVTISNIPIIIIIIISLWLQWYIVAIICIVISRFLDGLDGAISRFTHSNNPASGYLDIMVDFVFYISIPLGFIMADVSNAVASSLVLGAYTLTGVNFMASSATATKLKLKNYSFPNKALYYATNVIEGAETIFYSLLVCIFPKYFIIISYVYALVLFITTPILIYFRWKYFKKSAYHYMNKT